MRYAKALLIAACALAVAAPSAGATSGPCNLSGAGPTCRLWYGTVTFIGDGDTVSVRLDGHPKDRPIRVRVTGIQAMEEHVYTTDRAQRRGECQANEATARLEDLVHQSKGRVQLAAQDPASNSGGRPRRQVRVLIHGRWTDVGRLMMNEGLVLPLANSSEWALNATYSALGQRAAAQRIGIWNSYYCGPGPDDLAYLRVWVNSNPPGNEDDNPNGEWVKVKNLDPARSVAIGGWWLRDSALRRYTFPAGATVVAGSSVTMFVGRGADTATDFFWGQRNGVFDNVSDDGHGRGDGAYLFDTEGDLRAWMVYPCRYKCGDPLKGALSVSAHPKGTEYVKVTNTSKSPVNLEGYQLVAGQYNYAFPAGTILQPGDTLRVDVAGDPAGDQPLHKYWGVGDASILYNGGGSTRISTFDFVTVACDSWGTGSCPSR